jgi:hypothetical protein
MVYQGVLLGGFYRELAQLLAPTHQFPHTQVLQPLHDVETVQHFLHFQLLVQGQPHCPINGSLQRNRIFQVGFQMLEQTVQVTPL